MEASQHLFAFLTPLLPYHEVLVLSIPIPVGVFFKTKNTPFYLVMGSINVRNF